MKFLSTAEEKLSDKKLKLTATVSAPTNTKRFVLYDLGQDTSLAGRIAMSEYVLDHCVIDITVGAQTFTPEQMKQADLTDDKTATVYFGLVDLVVSHQLNIEEDEAEAKK